MKIKESTGKKSAYLMKKLKDFAFKKPVLFSIILIIITISFTEIPLKNLYLHFINNQCSNYLQGITEQGFASIILILLLTKLGFKKQGGLTTPPYKWKDLWVIWPLIALTIINFDSSLKIDTAKPVTILLYTLTYLSTGIFEEVLLRGVVLSVLLNKWRATKKGIYLSVVVSSVLFGIPHIVNFIQNRMSLGATITNIVFATFLGVCFSACYLRNKSLWPVIIIHAAFDLVGSIKEIAVGGGIETISAPITLESALSSIIITLPLFLYGLYILKKVSPDTLKSDF